MRRMTDGARTRDLPNATIRISSNWNSASLSQNLEVCRGFLDRSRFAAYRGIPPDIAPIVLPLLLPSRGRRGVEGFRFLGLVLAKGADERILTADLQAGRYRGIARSRRADREASAHRRKARGEDRAVSGGFSLVILPRRLY